MKGDGKMATLIKVDGTESEVTPAKKRFTVEEMQEAIGGYWTPIRLDSNTVMLVVEDGLPRQLPENREASLRATQRIVGDVLIGHRREFGL